MQGKVRQWDNGRPDRPVPQALLIGSPSCIANGDQWPRALPVVDLVGGWDARCPERVFLPFDQWDCHFQQWTLDVLNELYFGTEASTRAVALSRYPSASVYVVQAGEQLTPGVCIVRIPGAALCIVSGTRNLLQWLVQVLQGVTGPTSYAYYSTLSFWQTCSLFVFDQMSYAGVDGTSQLVLVGHSMGGAVAALVAAQAKRFTPTRNIGLLTFGAPKVGDERLTLALFKILQQNFVAEGDPIPFLPPSGLEAYMLQALIGLTVIQFCAVFVPLPARTQLNVDGTRTEDFSADAITAFLYAEVFRLLNDPFGVFGPWAHTVDNYRSLLLCPGEVPPIPVFKYQGFGGGVGDGSGILGGAVYRAEGGCVGDGEGLLVQRAAGGVVVNGEAIPPDPWAVLLSDLLHDTGTPDLADHIIMPTNIPAAHWDPHFVFIVYPTFALLRADVAPQRQCGLNSLEEHVRVTARCYPVPPGGLWPAGRAIGVSARGPDQFQPGWTATVVDNGDGTGTLRLYDATGFSGFDSSIALPTFAAGDVVELVCLGSVVYAKCNGVLISGPSDIYLNTNTYCGLVGEPPASPFDSSPVIAEFLIEIPT